MKFEIEIALKDKDWGKAWILSREFLRFQNPTDYFMLFSAAKCHRAVGDYQEAQRYAILASKNYYIGQKNREEPIINEFLKSLEGPRVVTPAPPGASRQVRRAMERSGEHPR